MTLEKAIEIISQHQKGTDPLYLPDLPVAEKLSLEALKRQKEDRFLNVWCFPRPLPGETEK